MLANLVLLVGAMAYSIFIFINLDEGAIYCCAYLFHQNSYNNSIPPPKKPKYLDNFPQTFYREGGGSYYCLFCFWYMWNSAQLQHGPHCPFSFDKECCLCLNFFFFLSWHTLICAIFVSKNSTLSFCVFSQPCPVTLYVHLQQVYILHLSELPQLRLAAICKEQNLHCSS